MEGINWEQISIIVTRAWIVHCLGARCWTKRRGQGRRFCTFHKYENKKFLQNKCFVCFSSKDSLEKRRNKFTFLVFCKPYCLEGRTDNLLFLLIFGKIEIKTKLIGFSFIHLTKTLCWWSDRFPHFGDMNFFQYGWVLCAKRSNISPFRKIYWILGKLLDVSSPTYFKNLDSLFLTIWTEAFLLNWGRLLFF